MTKSNPAMNKISHQQAADEIFFHIFARIPAFFSASPLANSVSSAIMGH
jgi:hypothetical protein